MSNILFTSDTHFYHKNVIEYSKRPFSSMEEMNEVMIARWNANVTKNDVVYHLGDFILSSKLENIENILSRLNGSIILIQGNHDTELVKKLSKIDSNLADKIIKIYDYLVIKPRVFGVDQYMVLMHYPIEVWDRKHYGSIHLHGHCHNNNPTMNYGLKRFNVGVDMNHYCPRTLESIVQELIP